MTWFDRLLDLLHLAWFEVTQVIHSVWARISAPLWIFLLFGLILIGAIAVISAVVIGGVAIESTWVIFWGGILILGMIVLVGVVLFPVALGVNIILAVYRRLIRGIS